MKKSADFYKNAVKKSTIKSNNIKLMADNPGLKDKISVHVPDGSDKVFWYIRFNLSLDPKSVNPKTMKVMDSKGFILETEISYSPEFNLIVISPVDAFEKNEFYILKIRGNVRSEKKQKLKNEINILFKLLNGEVSGFEVLKRTVALPKLRPRPTNYLTDKPDSVTPVKKYTSFGTAKPGPEHGKLPFSPIRINVWIGVAGLFLTIISLFRIKCVFLN